MKAPLLLSLLLACDGDGLPPDGDPLTSGYRGQAQVDQAYVGSETYYTKGADGYVTYCQVAYDVVSTADVTADCSACTWAFELVSSKPTASITAICPENDDPALLAEQFDGATFAYGFSDDYYGKSVLFYRFEGYWLAMAYAEFDGSAFSYDWSFDDGRYDRLP